MTDTSSPPAPLGQRPSAEEEDALLFQYSNDEHDSALQIAGEWLVKFPAHHLGWKVAGYIYQSRNQFDQALAHLEQAVALGPQDPSDLNNIGILLTELGRLQEAQSHFECAVDILPKYGKAWTNLAMVFQLRHEYSQAQVAAQMAVSLDETDAAALIQLGNAFEAQGLLSQAQASYYRADMAHEPRRAVAHSNVLYLMNHDVLVEPEHLFAEHLAFSEQFEKPLRANLLGNSNAIDKIRQLKVGFVSGDFCHHALNDFLEPAFIALAARAGLSLYAYSTGTREDDVTRRMRKYFAYWHSVADLSDDALAQQIHSDAIDILIDLSGHTAKNRLLTFARKPAPVQMSWLGYLGTTGLEGMDYYLCDDYWIPQDKLDWQFTEKMAYMPSAVVFQPAPLAPPVNTLPALRNGYITFGSFNRVTKINESVIALWSMVMQQLPTSKMVLAGIEIINQPAIIATFTVHGVEPDRLQFYPRVAIAEYLALHHQVDFCLDTFPHGGGATTAHAAWMGVPTLCLAGETPASRFSATLMHHLGLDRFIAGSIDEFLEHAVTWAGQVRELSRIRESMRQQFQESSIGQPKLFAQHMEATLREAWAHWCADTTASNRLADSLIKLALDNEHSGNPTAAAYLYVEALKLTSENAALHHQLGMLEMTLKGPGDALPRFEAAIQLQPNEEAHWVAYIDALIQTGALETAASALEWGQKYGLSTATAERISANCVAAIDKARNPPATDIVSAYSEDELEWPAAPLWPAQSSSLSANLDYIRQPASTARRYVIVAPPYRHNSAGIRVMYDLQKWLILAGFDAIVIATLRDCDAKQFVEDIVIYPEVVAGNPLQARRVVRYILNVPGKIGGTRHYARHELLVAYNDLLAEHANGKILNLPTIEPFFCKPDKPGVKLAVYVGKGIDLKLHPKECIYITRNFPSTRLGVAELLQQVSIFYTYDNFTAIAAEALLCGCKVKVIQQDGKISDMPDSVLNSVITATQNFKIQFHNFVEATKLL